MNVNEQTEKAARMNLRRMLRTISRVDPDLPGVLSDGGESGSAREAIRAFQQKNGLPVSGEADRETWEALTSAARRAEEETAPPLGFCPFPKSPAGAVLRAGEDDFAVRTVRYLLSELSLLFPSFAGIGPGGPYDAHLADAVREFQSRCLLPPTGEVDRRTWNCLVRLYETLPLYE